VVVERDGRVERIGARRILAANGFAANQAMLALLPGDGRRVLLGGEGNTGEAIRWGQALGGAVAFMDAYQAHVGRGSARHPHHLPR
jgi:fumarate reductase flavoprotein subunit